MPASTFRNSKGELIDLPAIPATRVKNAFSAVLDQAIHDGAVAITRHDKPKAVLISFAEFEALAKLRSPALDELGAQFDGLLAGMQSPKARKGMAAAFDAAPAELGRAAVAAAATVVKAARKAAPPSRPAPASKSAPPSKSAARRPRTAAGR